MSDDDKALVKQIYEQADRRHGSIGSLCSLEWKAADRIEAQAAEIEAYRRSLYLKQTLISDQAAEIERLREALHTPLAFIEALHENDPDDQIADNGMTVLDGLKQQAPSIIKTIREALAGKAEQ